MLDRFLGTIRVARDEAGNRVQRIEKEVRIHLRAQRLQLRTVGVQHQFPLPLLVFQALLAQAQVLQQE